VISPAGDHVVIASGVWRSRIQLAVIAIRALCDLDPRGDRQSVTA
jgi:hypothetical protein